VDAAGERRYPGTCRGRGLERDERHVLRARIPDEEVVIDDLALGRLVQHPSRDAGDVVIRDAHGQWTYQFCVVVDDLHDGVDLIVRGEDLVASTGTQWLLARMLGRAEMPMTLHHPLLRGTDGDKLSKLDRSETVRAMRERGMRADEVIARAVRGATSRLVDSSDPVR
jgi:glutamyl-tRNA synthetase/glutamyl-Q tRNA(Asp) synthetase